MQTKSVRQTAAVIGLGVGEQHARTLAADPRVDLKWLVDIENNKAEKLARELGGQAGDETTVFSDKSVTFISIASTDDAHYGQVCSALSNGKHVFVEKPLCRTFEELSRIREMWSITPWLGIESNLVLRMAPIYIWLKDAIRDGEFGEIYAFDADYLYGRVNKVTEGWRSEVDNYSVMSGGGVHMVDLMLFLTDQRPVTVQTIGNKIVTRDTKFRYTDFQASTYQFDSGMIGRITSNFGCVHHHQHYMRIFGTKATFLLDDQGPRLFDKRDRELKEKFPQISSAAAAATLPYAVLPCGKGALIPDFLDALESGPRLAFRARQNFDVIAIIIASDRSQLSGRSIEIEYE